MIDIDGTICDDIKNEDSHLYPSAKVFPDSISIINKLYDDGNTIVFFTARDSKDKTTTLTWLWRNGFKFHDLIMNKPRCIEDDCEYIWIDNKPVISVRYDGDWNSILELKN